MDRTPLYDRLISAGARLGEYCGVETALSFGDAKAEYETLLSGCAVYDMGWRAKIMLKGSDRVRWANGMVTNNIRDLKPSYGNYNFMLNAQGRIQADLYAYSFGDWLLVDTEWWQKSKILELFDKFIIMDDVEVADISGELSGLAVQGPKALDLLRAIGFESAEDVEPLKVGYQRWNDFSVNVTRMASKIARTYELWALPQNVLKLWDALIVAGAKPVGTDALEMFRVAAGVPRYGVDITEKHIPQETEQLHALHFAKGCYLGQEIVERVRSRGAVHRHFTGFKINGPTPSNGAETQSDGKKVGEITSALRVPVDGQEVTLALGYVRNESGAPGTKLQVEGSEAEVQEPPFKEALKVG
jgi:aminomethyltransferase